MVSRAVLDPEALYRQLSAIVDSMPADLDGRAPGPDLRSWLGKAFALVEVAGDVMDTVSFKSKWTSLGTPLGADAAEEIRDILVRALARAELQAPVSVQGSFIAKGAGFDAYQMISKVLRTATNDVLIVDPYLDEVALFEFVPLAPAGVSVRLLGDSFNAKLMQSLKTGVARWKQQHGGAHPLEARQTGPRLLHDRLIFIDDRDVWSLSQSLKDFAARSHASIIRVGDDIGALKVPAYQAMWQSSTPL